MTVEEQLKAIIVAKYKSVRAFTNVIGMPYSTLDSVFKRGISGASIENMLKVFSELGLDIESIATGKLEYLEPSADQFHLTITDTDPQIDRILSYAKDLNASGLAKLGDYAEDLAGNPAYKKKNRS